MRGIMSKTVRDYFFCQILAESERRKLINLTVASNNQIIIRT